MHEGTVTKVKLDGGYGFIRSEGEDFFFHRSDLDGLEFNEQLVEMAVRFDIEQAPKGPRQNVTAA